MFKHFIGELNPNTVVLDCAFILNTGNAPLFNFMTPNIITAEIAACIALPIK